MNYWWVNANSLRDESNLEPFSWTDNVVVGQMEEWYSKKSSGRYKESREIMPLLDMASQNHLLL